MAAVTVSVVAKKALAALAGSKSGRHFLLYAVGILLFLVLLPFIMLFGLFGWMSGGDLQIDHQTVLAALPAADRAMIANIDKTCEAIQTAFSDQGLAASDGKKAVEIYIACLIGKETSSFPSDLIACFTNITDDASVYNNIAAKFSVSFTAEERQYFDEKYGVTKKPIIQSVDTSGFTDPATKNNTDLVIWAKNAEKAGWGYVYGTYSTVLTEAMLQAKIAQFPDDVGGYEPFIRQNWLGKRTADCIGLIKGYSWYNVKTGEIDIGANGMPDVGANTMFNNAQIKGPIDTMPETPGLAVWHDGHIGIYIGGGEVVQAAQTTAGVIKTKVAGSSWTHWLKIPYIQYK